MVRSLFENCSVIWRPTTQEMLHKVESIQRRAVKWILSEDGHHYNDFEYLRRLKDLDLLPMEYKFNYTDLVLFHSIFYNRSVIKLPSYFTPFSDMDRGRLTSNIKTPNNCNSEVTAHMNAMRRDRVDPLSLKCSVEPKCVAYKNNFFFRTHLLWNRLPKAIRECDNANEFQNKLKHHMWDIVLDPD